MKMKSLNTYILEWKFDNKKNVNDVLKYNFFPKSIDELHEIIIDKLRENIEDPYLSDIDTSRIDWMSALFSNFKENYLHRAGIDSSKIKRLDLRNWDVSNVEKMEEMFYECTGLEELLISTWKTPKLDSTERMFYHCKNLKEINLQNFCTENVRSMQYMFAQCLNLKRLDLRSFDTSSVDDMAYMFEECSSLEYIDASTFNTGEVEHMRRICFGCAHLKTIKGVETWNINLIDQDPGELHQMFQGCPARPKWAKEIK